MWFHGCNFGLKLLVQTRALLTQPAKTWISNNESTQSNTRKTNMIWYLTKNSNIWLFASGRFHQFWPLSLSLISRSPSSPSLSSSLSLSLSDALSNLSYSHSWSIDTLSLRHLLLILLVLFCLGFLNVTLHCTSEKNPNQKIRVLPLFETTKKKQVVSETNLSNLTRYWVIRNALVQAH